MLTTTKRQTWLLALLSLAFGSCASMLNNQSEPVMVRTNPSQAEVYDEHDVLLGTTPFDIRSVKNARQNLKIRKKGFQELTIGVSRTPRKELMFLDALLLCIPCPFDQASGAWYTLNKFDHEIRLRKEPKEHDKSVLVSIDKPQFKIGGSDEVGKINNRVKHMDDAIQAVIGYMDNCDRIVVNAFEGSYVSASRLSSDENEKNSLLRPRLILKPYVDKFYFTYTGKNVRSYQGTCTMSGEWKLFDIANDKKVLASFPMETSALKLSNNYDQVLELLFREAVRDLLDIDTLYEMLATSEKRYLVETK
jgi:hypothetical protein